MSDNDRYVAKKGKYNQSAQVPLNGFSLIHYRNSEIIEIPYEEYSIDRDIEEFFNDENIDEMA